MPTSRMPPPGTPPISFRRTFFTRPSLGRSRGSHGIRKQERSKLGFHDMHLEVSLALLVHGGLHRLHEPEARGLDLLDVRLLLLLRLFVLLLDLLHRRLEGGLRILDDL